MKKNLLRGILPCLFLLTSNVYSQALPSSTTKPTSSSTKSTTTFPEREFLQLPEKKTAPAQKTPLPTPAKPPPQVAIRSEYLHPGILVYLNGKWEGSDHLLNLSNNIGVYVTIVKPEDDTLPVSQEQLKKEVETIFEKVNIKPTTMAAQGAPPLPAFEIEIFLYPIDKGYAACCDGRLFESVILDRFKMDPNMAFQAITWEKQSLIVGPKTSFAEQLIQTVQSIATAFAERYSTYERMKSEIFH